jgi:hypothetical protein
LLVLYLEAQFFTLVAVGVLCPRLVGVELAAMAVEVLRLQVQEVPALQEQQIVGAVVVPLHLLPLQMVVQAVQA